MRPLFLIIVLFLCVGELSAQRNIAIHGSAANGAGRRVELLKTSDAISGLESVIDSATIDDNNSFELRCYANYPMLVTLQVENYSQSFFVEPATEYSVFIPSFDWNLDEKRNIFLDPEPLPLVFQNLKTGNVNSTIDSIDRYISNFVSDNYFYFDQKFKPSAYYFDSLETLLRKAFPDGRNDFVDRYKMFQLAQLKYSLKFDSRRNLVKRYIKNQPILYHDENYMSLFATLYAYSISKGTKDIPVYRLAHWVNNLDLETYIDSIGVDPLLRHEQVRELAALQALRESYYNFHYYNPDMVVKMIQKLAQKSKFPEHRLIADNIIRSFHNREESESFSIYDVSLPDVDKQAVSLGSFEGKWIYIAFVRSGDPFSVSEIETMAHFKEDAYKNKNVEFVSIDCDREFQKMFHFLKNTKHGDRFNWTWLHFDGNYQLLRNFQVTAYPWFVLINPQGKVQYDITPAPSSGFLLNAPWNDTPVDESSPSNHPLFRR